MQIHAVKADSNPHDQLQIPSTVKNGAINRLGACNEYCRVSDLFAQFSGRQPVAARVQAERDPSCAEKFERAGVAFAKWSGGYEY
jgi:hypothetical protein